MKSSASFSSSDVFGSDFLSVNSFDEDHAQPLSGNNNAWNNNHSPNTRNSIKSRTSQRFTQLASMLAPNMSSQMESPVNSARKAVSWSNDFNTDNTNTKNVNNNRIDGNQNKIVNNQKSVRNIMNLFEAQSTDPWDDVETSTVGNDDGTEEYTSTSSKVQISGSQNRLRQHQMKQQQQQQQQQHNRSKDASTIFRRNEPQNLTKNNGSNSSRSLSAPFRHPRGAVINNLGNSSGIGNNQSSRSQVPNLIDDELTSVGTNISSPRQSPIDHHTQNIQNGNYSPTYTATSSLYFTDDNEDLRAEDDFLFNPRGNIENSLLVKAAKTSQASRLIANHDQNVNSSYSTTKNQMSSELGQEWNFRNFDTSAPSNRHRSNISLDACTESNLSGTLIGEDVLDDDIYDDHSSRSYGSGFSEGTSSVASSYLSNGLGRYYIEPRIAQRLVRRYRRLSANDSDPDATKRFALFEMRSRIMESDMERGLERKGWTRHVDDIVLTPSQLASMRVRDAVIVAKAWRDGASPTDVTTAWTLGRRDTHQYHIARRYYQQHNRNREARIFYERVDWLDDCDFVTKQCSWLGPRALRGFEMFTIGDCQSLLLKLTNERCVQLRQTLHLATQRQLKAEEEMARANEDRSNDEESDEEEMTPSEWMYLQALEEVKGLSSQLVKAEHAFQLVRDRIENLITKYEKMLVNLETDDQSSIESNDDISQYNHHQNSQVFDTYHIPQQQQQQQQILEQRAKQAELQVEVAAREILLAKEEAERVRQEKQRELEILQKRLHDLEQQSILEKERSAQLVSEYERRLMERNQQAVDNEQDVRKDESLDRIPLSALDDSSFQQQLDTSSDARSYLESAISKRDQDKIAARERVKAKFRERTVMNKQLLNQSRSMSKKTTSQKVLNNFYSKNQDNEQQQSRVINNEGESLYNRIEFYEKALQSVK